MYATAYPPENIKLYLIQFRQTIVKKHAAYKQQI